MNSDQTPPPKPDAAVMHPMVVLQPGERVICDIKRHPFGIIVMYAAGLFAMVVVIILVTLAPSLFNQSVAGTTTGGNSSEISGLLSVGAIIFCVLIGLVLLVATKVYWQNRWVVTDDSITQITQDSLFGRRVSQLSMENLEDVTIDQHGILQTMFDFGTLRAETAGEKSKFVFQYCPNPKKMARAILEVHENFLHQIRHQPQQVNPVMPVNGPHFDEGQGGFAAPPAANGAVFGQNQVVPPTSQSQYAPPNPSQQQLPATGYQAPVQQQPWQTSPTPTNNPTATSTTAAYANPFYPSAQPNEPAGGQPPYDGSSQVAPFNSQYPNQPQPSYPQNDQQYPSA